ncbi:MAG: hypothetical protein V7785_13680 [Bermanella sp.]
MFKLRLVLPALMLLLLSACASSPEKQKLDTYQSDNADVYFVPIGNMSDKYKLDLLTHLEKIFPLKFSFTPYLKLRKEMIDPKKSQVFADKLLQYIDKDFGSYSDNKKAIYIGITHIDMRPTKESDSPIITKNNANKVAVVANRRMKPSNKETIHLINIDTVIANTRKMISRNIGMLLYGKSINNDPKSVLYGNITSLEVLDNIQEQSVFRDILKNEIISQQ